jgi:RNA polymerase sigma-70 factor (ECF subfamily)
MAIEGALSGRVARWIAAAPDWDEVYAAELPRVYNFFRYRFGNVPEVEDLTSRTFQKAWVARHRYRRDLAGFATWLMSIARNVAIDHYRAHRSLASIDDASHVPAPGGTPEDEVIRGSEADRLASLLSGLPARERELVALKYGAGMTNRDIAGTTGLSESNVGTILHRAVQTLRERW